MRKESGRLRAVCEASPVTHYWQPLTSAPKAPALSFLINSVLEGYAVMTHVHSLLEQWLPVSIAPSDADLEVCVMDYDGILHALVFPCRKNGTEWVNPATKQHIDIQPTHWRKWAENR
jgi:hypothetical protein